MCPSLQVSNPVFTKQESQKKGTPSNSNAWRTWDTGGTEIELMHLQTKTVKERKHPLGPDSILSDQIREDGVRAQGVQTRPSKDWKAPVTGGGRTGTEADRGSNWPHSDPGCLENHQNLLKFMVQRDKR